jgi:bacillithiol synthase
VRVDCYPISLLPRLSRLFLDYTESRDPIAPFYAATPFSWKSSTPEQTAAHRTALADLLRERNLAYGAGEKALANIDRLRNGSPAIVTGQQVALFGGPLFTLFKAATAIHRAQKVGAVPIFWLASEDHDLAEVDHVTLPARHALHTLRLHSDEPPSSRPVGNIPLGPQITQLLDRAAELIGGTPEFDLLAAAYTPQATWASAFARWLSAVFADYGLIVLDASSRPFHALGAPVLRHALEHAADLEAALHERDRLLADRGYHAQVLVAPGSSLLFLIDEATGARLPLRRKNGSWITTSPGAPKSTGVPPLSAGQGGMEKSTGAPPLSAGQGGSEAVGRQGGIEKTTWSTADLLSILASTPERLSPNALLRPVFQDYLLPTAAYIAGPAEIAYFAQSQVLYEKILGRTTPVLPRLSATLIEPSIGKVLAQHDLSLAEILAAHPDELAHRLGARALPVEGKHQLAAAGNALDAELQSLVSWMESLSPDLGRSAHVSASKMRYQMNRLRRLAANHQLQREGSIRRHVDTLFFNLFPDRHPQERSIGGVAYLSRVGTSLLSTLIDQSAGDCPGHKAIWL